MTMPGGELELEYYLDYRAPDWGDKYYGIYAPFGTRWGIVSGESVEIQSKNQIALLLGVNPEAITIPLAKRVPLSHVRVATGIPSDTGKNL